MTIILIRLALLAGLVLFTCLLVWSGRRFVEMRRRQALAAAPPVSLPALSHTDTIETATQIRILAFGSEDCHQCHQLQEPALKRVVDARGSEVSVVYLDAPTEAELTQRYHVLTVPATVILDVTGRAYAVNYGFASTQRLLEQIDEALVKL